MGKGRGRVRRLRGQPYQVEYSIDGSIIDCLEVPAAHAGTRAGVLVFAALQLALRPDLVNVNQLRIKVGPRSISGVKPKDMKHRRTFVDAVFDED